MDAQEKAAEETEKVVVKLHRCLGTGCDKMIPEGIWFCRHCKAKRDLNRIGGIREYYREKGRVIITNHPLCE